MEARNPKVAQRFPSHKRRCITPNSRAAIMTGFSRLHFRTTRHITGDPVCTPTGWQEGPELCPWLQLSRLKGTMPHTAPAWATSATVLVAGSVSL